MGQKMDEMYKLETNFCDQYIADLNSTLYVFVLQSKLILRESK